MCRPLKQLRLFVPDRTAARAFALVFANRWATWEISSFKYLSKLNLLAGRTYADSKFYPAFPSLAVDFDTCDEVGKVDPNGLKKIAVDHPDGQLTALPELYFYPEICGSFDAIYQNRKKLEGLANLDVWIVKVFGNPKVAKMMLFDGPHPTREPFIPPACDVQQLNLLKADEEKILVCLPLKLAHGSVGFAGFFESGSLRFIELSFDTAGCANIRRTCSVTLENAASARVYSLGNLVCTFDGTTVTVLERTGKGAKTYKTDCHIANKLFFSGGCFSSGEPVLYQINGPDPRWEVRVFTTLRARICSVASSSRFNITAVGCEDGKLRIRSNVHGRKVATVGLDQEIPTGVLITEKWGLIVVKTPASLFVFNVNGMLVNKMPDRAMIRLWTAFHTRDSCDFICYQDTDFNVFYFEAAEPTVRMKLDTQPNLCAIQFDWKFNCFVFVAVTGKVMIMPRREGEGSL
jgi:hypothetical protein